jgi:hypothetical protein
MSFIEEYQFSDPETGVPIGPPQRFEAETEGELIKKLVAAHKSASVAYYKAKQTAKLGSLISPDEETPIPQFEEKPLSADELVRLSSLLKDPRTADEGMKLWFKSTFGQPVETFRQTMQEAAIRNRAGQVNDAITMFQWKHPEYVACDANEKLIEKWLNKSTPPRPVTSRNLELAYEALTDDAAEDKLIIRAPQITDIPATPVAATEPATVPTEVATASPAPVEIPPAPTPAPPISDKPAMRVVAPAPRPVPALSSSGLGRANTTATPVVTPPKAKELTYQELSAMSSTEIAKRLATDPEFAKQVDNMSIPRLARR